MEINSQLEAQRGTGVACSAPQVGEINTPQWMDVTIEWQL